jgi:hypothetical protein
MELRPMLFGEKNYGTCVIRRERLMLPQEGKLGLLMKQFCLAGWSGYGQERNLHIHITADSFGI